MKNLKQLMIGLLAGVFMLAIPGFSAFDPVNDDTDIFLNNPNVPGERPNIMIILDNTANWSNAFANEKAALVSTVNGLDDRYNLGLMLYPETGGGNDSIDGGYVRFGIRQMTSTYKSALSTLVGNLNQTSDKGNNATISLAMAEAYYYFNAKTNRASYGKVKTDWPGNTGNSITASLGGSPLPASPTAASAYNSPIANACQRNFIIYISNGPANENSSSASVSQALLTTAMGQTPTTIGINPSGQQSNWSDEWAKFMSASTVPVITYTVEVDPGSQNSDLAMTALMKSMATNSGGKYFSVSSSSGGTQITDALNKIFTEVQAVNSVFASTSLPVSVNVRGTNINQVYIGVFRPDADLLPRWYGNLKLYQVGFDTTTSKIYLADANGSRADNAASGFITNTAQSFWTSSSTFWGFRTTAQNGSGGNSDSPDGDLVEKGGAAQMLRVAYPTDQSTRNLYTCSIGAFGNCLSGSALSGTPFSTANTDITGANLNLGTRTLSPLTGYVTQTLTSIADRQSVSLSNAGSGSLAVSSLSNGGTTVAISSLTTAVAKSITALSGATSGSATYAISGVTKSGSNYIFTTTTTHGFTIGTSVTMGGTPSPKVNFAGTSAANWNGNSYTLTAVSGTTFTVNPSGNPGNSFTTFGSATGIANTSTTSARATVPAHGYATGQSVTIAGAAPSAFNGTYNITRIDADNFSYTMLSAQAATTTLGTASGNTQTATATTSSAHAYAVSNSIGISGASLAGYNGTITVLSVPTTTSFTYTVSGGAAIGPNTASGVTATRGATTAVTATVGGGHGLANGTYAGYSISGASSSGFNVSNTSITVNSATTFTYTASSADAANTSASVTASTSTIATVTGTAALHGFAVNDSVIISGETGTPASHNGTFTVLSVPTANTFTYSTGIALATPTGTIVVRPATAKAWVTKVAHGYTTAQTVTIAGATPAGYNVTATVTRLSADVFTVPLAAAPGANTGTTLTASLKTTTAKAYSPAHGFATNDSVTVTGATPTSFNGTFTITVTDGSNFTYTIAGAEGDATGVVIASSSSGASSSQRTALINWVRGQDNQEDENANGSLTDVRSSIHGDVLHSQPAVVNYNRRSSDAPNKDNDVYIYYGSNDGIFRAVKGGTASTTGDPSPGKEVWGFIPTEFFGTLDRLRTNSPLLSSLYKKPYFADGSIGAYVKDGNNDGSLSSAVSDVANLYVSMRRGGRFIYALNVLDPLTPKFLWKKISTDMGVSELGQTWSQPQVIPSINASTSPVLLFGAGYDDQVEDLQTSAITSSTSTSVTTAAGTFNRTMGRGIYMLNALTGAIIWQAAGRARAVGDISTHPYLLVSGMDCSISADIAVTRNQGNTATYNRGYAVDSCGNVWRMDFNDADPANWKVTKLAAIGGTATNASRRKFQFAPDVVYRTGYDAVLLGSGDREHPFDTTVTNRFYMIKDYAKGALSTDSSGTALYATATEASLYDATSNCIQDASGCPSGVTSSIATASLTAAAGWYVTLGSGEKTVGAALAQSGTVIFVTNQPATVATSGVCTSNLGTARTYEVSVDNATATLDLSAGGGLTTADRSLVYAGGGYLPSPVPVVVQITTTTTDASGNVTTGTKTASGAFSGPNPIQTPGPALNTRVRKFWYKEID